MDDVIISILKTIIKKIKHFFDKSDDKQVNYYHID